MKKRGFTLIELLAVIFIIGLLAVIIYPNITRMVLKSKQDSFNVQIQEIENAASKWALKYASYIPSGETVTIRLIDLKKEGLIDKDLINPLNNKKFPDDMIIKIIFKDGKFKYEVDANSGTPDENIDLNKPSIILVGLPYEKVEINTIYKDKGAVATDSKGNKITSEKIIKKITRNNVEVSKIDTSDFYKYKIEYSISDPYNGKKASVERNLIIKDTTPPVLKIPPHKTISKADLSFNVMEGVSASDNSLKSPTIVTEGNVSLGIPGDYIIKYTATDGSGNSRSKKRTITVSNDLCTRIKINGNVSSGKLTNKDVILTAYLQNGHSPSEDTKYRWQKEVSGNWIDIPNASARSYKVTENSENSRYRLVTTIGDCNVVSNVYQVVIDKIPPRITPKLFYMYEGNESDLYIENTWTNKKVYTSCYGNDNVGIGELQISSDGKSWIPYKWDYTKEPYKISAEGLNYRYYRAKDKAGNYSEVVVKVIYIDKTAPTFTSKYNSSNGNWTNGNVDISAAATDSASGMNRIEYSYDNSTYHSDWTVKNPGSVSSTWSAERNNKLYIKATDNAGNNTYYETAVRIDKTAPKITPKLFFEGNGSNLYTENTWTNKNVYTSCHGTDNIGIEELQISIDGKRWIPYKYDYTKEPYKISAEGINYRYYRAKDKAGNYSSVVSRIIKIDKRVPTPTIEHITGVNSYSCSDYTGKTYGVVNCYVNAPWYSDKWQFSSSEYDGLSGHKSWWGWFNATGSSCTRPPNSKKWNTWYENTDGIFDKSNCSNAIYKIKNEDVLGNKSAELIINITYTK